MVASVYILQIFFSIINAETFTRTWNKANGDVHLIDGGAECGGDGSKADEEASHHYHWTIAKAVAQQCRQWSWKNLSETITPQSWFILTVYVNFLFPS